MVISSAISPAADRYIMRPLFIECHFKIMNNNETDSVFTLL